MNDNIKAEKTYSIIPNEYYYRIKLLFRRSLPSSQLIFFIITLTKYIPILLFTHAIPPNSTQNILTLSKLFAALTTFNSTSWNYSYITLCIIIYIFILFIIISSICLIIYLIIHSKHTDDELYNIPNNKVSLPSKMKSFIKVITYLFLLLIFFYQHVIEILFREIFCFTINPNNISNYVNNDTNIKSILNDRKLSLLILNIIFICFTLILLYAYFDLVETKTMNSTFGYKSTLSDICVYINMFMFSLLGCYSSLNLIKDSHKYFICITYICTFLCFINSLTRLRLIQIKGKNSFVNNVFVYGNDFCFVSGVIEIIIYHTLNETYFHSQRFYFEKILCDIVNTVLYTWLIKIITRSLFTKRLVNTFFSEYRYFDIRDYYNFYLYLDSFNNSLSKKFVFVYNLYYLHKKVCTIDNCQCKLIEETSFTMQESEFAKTVEIFLSIVEDKLNDNINSNSIYKEKGTSIISPYLIIYVDNLFTVRKNKSLVVYTSQYYLIQYNKVLSYENAYMLYELNYLSYKAFKGDDHVRKKKKKKKKICYIKRNLLREKTEKVIVLLLSVLEKFFYYKHIKNNGGKILYTCEDVLHVLNKYVKYNNILTKLISKCLDIGLFDDIEELKYSIINFNNIIHLNLPFKYTNKFHHMQMHFNYNEYYLNNTNAQDGCVPQNKQHHSKTHMILYLKVENTFIIRYASLLLSMCLLYNKDELIDKDFNNMLIPNVIAEYHNLYMKYFILYGYTAYMKKTFLVNKRKQLLPVNAHIKVLPTLTTLSNLILQIEMYDNILHKQYHLMLNNEYNLISMSKSFEDEFVFTLDMFKTVKLNFCDFFGLNKERINQFFNYANPSEALKRAKREKEKSHCLLKGTTCIDSFIQNNNKDINVNVNNEINLSYFKECFGCKTFTKQQVLNSSLVEIINKDTIILSISKLIKSINEYGLETEWKEKLDFLYYKFTSLHVQNTHTPFFMQDNNTMKKSFTILSNRSGAVNNTSNNGNNNSNSSSIFYVLFHKKKIGQFSYFITTISENKKKEIDKEQQQQHSQQQQQHPQQTSNTKLINVNINSTIIQKYNFQNVVIGDVLPEIPLLKVKVSSPIDRANSLNVSNITDRSYTMTTPKSGGISSMNIASDARLIHNKENSEMLFQQTESLSGTATGLMMTNQSRNQLIKIDQRNEENKKKIKFPRDITSLSLRNMNYTVPKDRYNSITNTTSTNILTKSKSRYNNISSNYNYKNIELMFNKFQLKEKQLYYFKTFIFFCLFLLALLNVINLVLNYQLSDFSLHLFQINSYSFLIANDLYYGSLLVVISCLYNANYQIGNSTNAKLLIDQSSEDLINHYHYLNAHISYLIHKSEIKPIFDTLNNPIDFGIIKSNWNHTTRKVSFNEELYSLYYYLKTFDPVQDGQFCRVKRIFIDNDLNGIEPTKEEKFLFYIVVNMVSNISDVLENLMKQISDINLNHYNSTNVKSNAIKFVILALIVVIFIVEIVILKNMIHLFQEKMFVLFYPNEKETFLIESLKKYKYINQTIDNTTNNTSNNVNINNNTSSKDINISKRISQERNSTNTNTTRGNIVSPRKIRIGVRKKDSSRLSSFNNIKSDLKYSSRMRGQLHDSSGRRNTRKEQNAFQIQNTTLQNNTSSTITITSTTPTPTHTTTTTTDKETRSFTKIYRLKIVNYLLAILITIYVIYFLLEVLSMYVNSQESEGLVIENKFAINFLSRSPKINELILYAIISVLRNKEEFISKPYELYDKYVISNHYNIKLDVLSDSFITRLGNCNYAYLYYQLYIIRTNIQTFVNDDALFKYLKETTKAEFLFNEGYNFCIYAPMVYLQYYYSELPNDEMFIKLWNKEVKNCRMIGNGLNSAGYKSGLDVMLDIINNMYFNFYDGNLNTRQEVFLGNPKLKKVIENTIYMLRILHFSNAFVSIDDIQRTYQDKEKLTLLFSILLIGFSLLIISGMSLSVQLLFGKRISLVNQAVRDITISLSNININNNNNI